MIRNEIADPRSFIKPIPLQLPSHKGVKIQARSLNVYNATIPLREDVRKDNYVRRRDQMTCMGFKTPMNVPYKVIGEPLLLDYKSAVLHGLGQYQTDSKENDTKENQNVNFNSQKAQTKKQISPSQQIFSFRNFKKNKDLYNLQDEVNKTKYFIQRVKLGHSLFDLLNKEDEKRSRKVDTSSKSIQMCIRPMKDSDDEAEPESEEELTDPYYEPNGNFNTPEQMESNHNSVMHNHSNLQTPFNSENNNSALNNYDKIKQRTSNHDEINESINSNLNSNRPQTYPANGNYRKKTRPFTVPVNKSTSIMTTFKNHQLSKKKQEENKKPYTPIYSSLFSKEEGFLMDKETLTRQLCILLWLLESINTDSSNPIRPLKLCFSIKELSGEKSTFYNSNDIDKMWNNWSKYDKKKIAQKARDKERSRPKKSKQNHDQTNQEENQNVEIINEEDEQNKDVPKISDEISALFDPSLADEEFKQPNKKFNLADITLTLINLAEAAKERLAANQLAENVENRLESNRETVSNIDFTTTNREFVNNPNNNINENSAFNQNEIKRQIVSHNKSYTANTRQKSAIKKKESKPPIQILPDHELELIKIGNLDDMERIFSKSMGAHERRNSKSLKATTGPIHAQITDKVIEFQNKSSSYKKYQKLLEMREKFENLTDENTIDIHKRIEEIVKKRAKTCSLKYANMNLNEHGMHRMLYRMNRSVTDYYKLEDSKNTPEPKYYPWYTELETLVEAYYNRSDIMLGKILDKLSVYGKLNSKKQNELLFFRVLDTLRIWELISPDVMSAIEFCREKILEIHVEEFEGWFKKKHPDYFVSRINQPASAPPNLIKTK